jgi:hypothetical protein
MADPSGHPGPQPDLRRTGCQAAAGRALPRRQGHRRPGRHPGALGRHARDGPSRRRCGPSAAPAPAPTTSRWQGDERARRAGVQRAGRQCQRGQGTGARRHADGGAQHRPALPSSPALDPADPDLEKPVEDGKKAFAGFELAGQTLGVIGLGKHRLPGRRRRHQAGHAGAGLRPGHHRRRRLEPAVPGAKGHQRQRGAEAGAVRELARAAAGGATGT